MIRYAWFPDARPAPEWGERVLEIFRRHEKEIGSEKRALSGEQVLQALTADLREAGFVIEKRKLAVRQAPAQLLDRGSAFVRDQFDVFHPLWLCCLAIEDGRRSAAETGTLVEPLAVVDADTLCVALPNAGSVQGGEAQPTDYDKACELAQTLYSHIRVKLPYRLLLVGY